MPRMDFDGVPDSADYAPLPAGTYPMECVAATAARSLAGNEVWHLDLVEQESGMHVFDNLTWSPKAMSRVKLALRAFGALTTGDQDYQPDMLVRRRALVTVAIEDWTGKDGVTRKQNKVAFAGYEPAPQSAPGPDFVPEGCPF